ncbi:MAG: hypothetical protein A2Z34_07300 [Planctomycetes bacterium RBG_16_59_8]|nr:MAG: hypothetical protein A2Z34_07300 [Planctomycetes bacterium RBG_16_59_8]
MLTRTQDGKSRQICHYVKYGGISFDRTGNNVVVRVTLNTAKTGGGTHETYVETSVTLRNTSE